MKTLTTTFIFTILFILNGLAVSSSSFKQTVENIRKIELTDSAGKWQLIEKGVYIRVFETDKGFEYELKNTTNLEVAINFVFSSEKGKKMESAQTVRPVSRANGKIGKKEPVQYSFKTEWD